MLANVGSRFGVGPAIVDKLSSHPATTSADAKTSATATTVRLRVFCLICFITRMPRSSSAQQAACPGGPRIAICELVGSWPKRIGQRPGKESGLRRHRQTRHDDRSDHRGSHRLDRVELSWSVSEPTRAAESPVPATVAACLTFVISIRENGY